MIAIKEQMAISNNECWLCGTKKHLTKHHIIERRLKPIHNLVITLCNDCHTYIHDIQPKHLKQPTINNRTLPNGHKRKKEELINTIQQMSKELNRVRKIRDEYEAILMERSDVKIIRVPIEKDSILNRMACWFKYQ